MVLYLWIAVCIRCEGHGSAIFYDGMRLHPHIERAVAAVVDAQLVAGDEHSAVHAALQVGGRRQWTQEKHAAAKLLHPHGAQRGTLSARDRHRWR